MKNVMGVFAVLAVSGWVACASWTRGSDESTETGSKDPANQKQGARTGSGDCGCATHQCPDAGSPDDGGPACLDILVEASDGGGKHFSPGCNNGGWSMCEGQELIINSEMNQNLCIDLSPLRSNTDKTIKVPLSAMGTWTHRSLEKGQYKLRVCDNTTNSCDKGCSDSNDLLSGKETIRGNLDVVTKDPEPTDAR